MYNTVIRWLREERADMVRTVYVDLLFLVNFSMDFLCFFLVSRLFSVPMSVFRSIFASVFGGVYAVVSLFLPVRGFVLLLCDASACIVMCLIAEGRRGKGLTKTVSEILVFTGVSMALGGIMTAVYTFLGETGIPETLQSDGDGISAWLFLLLAAIGGGATMLGSRFFRRNAACEHYDVRVILCGRERTFQALIDTGNALTDPIGGAPAAVIGLSSARGFLPEEITRDALRSPSASLTRLPERYRSRARLLPVETVTGEGMLLAFRADVCYICPSDAPPGHKEKLTEKRELLIAVTAASPENGEMLLPPGIY